MVFDDGAKILQISRKRTSEELPTLVVTDLNMQITHGDELLTEISCYRKEYKKAVLDKIRSFYFHREESVIPKSPLSHCYTFTGNEYDLTDIESSLCQYIGCKSASFMDHKKSVYLVLKKRMLLSVVAWSRVFFPVMDEKWVDGKSVRFATVKKDTKYHDVIVPKRVFMGARNIYPEQFCCRFASLIFCRNISFEREYHCPSLYFTKFLIPSSICCLCILSQDSHVMQERYFNLYRQFLEERIACIRGLLQGLSGTLTLLWTAHEDSAGYSQRYDVAKALARENETKIVLKGSRNTLVSLIIESLKLLDMEQYYRLELKKIYHELFRYFR